MAVVSTDNYSSSVTVQHLPWDLILLFQLGHDYNSWSMYVPYRLCRGEITKGFQGYSYCLEVFQETNSAQEKELQRSQPGFSSQTSKGVVGLH